MNRHYTSVLTIAGSDPSGGAGIQADLKTFSALGCYGMSVITALTAQNTQGVQGVYAVPADFVISQLMSIFQDISVSALKIGMLHNQATIQQVTNFLKDKKSAIILDPVMVAKDGSLLLEATAMTALRELMPRVTLLTPNLPEAELLLQTTIHNHQIMIKAAKNLAALGPAAVLIKGGHLNAQDSDDCLYLRHSDEIIWLPAPRITTQNTHGTGCTLSAAIAALLAKNGDLVTAVREAKLYLTQALQAGKDYRLGQGQGPVQHFHAWWK